jgi:hypothetical protein
MTFQKIVGLITMLAGILVGGLTREAEWLSLGASAGLMMIFFAKERIDDERVLQLKMKAMFSAMSAGFGFNFMAHAHLFGAIAGWSGERRLHLEKISVSEFLAAIFLIALAFYHYWRWQDGRAEKSG